MVDQDFWRGKRVLLTGHSGFKGSWLSLWLSQLGAKVTGVGLEPEPRNNLFDQLELEKHIERHYIEDICNYESLMNIVRDAQPEVVFHLAAQPLVRRSYQQPLSTWSTNVMGSLHLLEALKSLSNRCGVVMVTTDKVYVNQGWAYGYRESDRLGGHDPYSASKAAAEIAISSWRDSFCGNDDHQLSHIHICTARAGNVIGGGDWSEDRIVPDAVRALKDGKPINVRNPNATRPWQHVLEPLSGYIALAENLLDKRDSLPKSFNFGPDISNNRRVMDLVETILNHWDGSWLDASDKGSPHEATLLHLQSDLAYQQLGWMPRWDYKETVKRTVDWYKNVCHGADPYTCTMTDIDAYQSALDI